MVESSIPDLSMVASPPRKSIDYTELSLSDTPIGSGGNAVVYEATLSDTSPPSQVAIKKPGYPDGDSIPKEVVQQFLDEAELWSTLDQRERQKPRWTDSEHIVGIIDTGEHLPWIAMEYMDDGSLAERLEQYPNGLPLAEALWIGECICHGIEVAHSYGIAHLDLKPENILFRQTPDNTWDVPKIGDWGLSRVLAEQSGTAEGLSIEYAAPEQFNAAEFGDPDTLTDIYQTGAIVYALLTGGPPFAGDQTSVMYDIVHGDRPTPVSNFRDDCADPLDTVVETALARPKDERYRNITTFGQALKAVRIGEPLPPIIARQTTSRGALNRGEPSSTDEGGTIRTVETTDRGGSISTNTGSMSPNDRSSKVPVTEDQELVLSGTEPNITVIGCGTAGCNTIDRMVERGLEGATLVASDTDVTHLASVNADTKLLLGEEVTEGKNAGSVPEVGKKATEGTRNHLVEAIEGSDIVFVVAGLGGGTGTGGAPVIAEIARDRGALTVPVVTLPFSAEGEVRRSNATAGLGRLESNSDTIIAVANDRLVDKAGHLAMTQAFKIADEGLVNLLKVITDITTQPMDGTVPYDLMNIRTVLEFGGIGTFGIGESDRTTAKKSVAKALDWMLLDVDLLEGDDMLLSITFRESSDENIETAEMIREYLKNNYDFERVVWGANVDESIEEQIRTTIVVTGVGPLEINTDR